MKTKLCAAALMIGLGTTLAMAGGDGSTLIMSADEVGNAAASGSGAGIWIPLVLLAIVAAAAAAN